MDETIKKPRRIWQVVLVGSLALNIAVVGIVAGTLLTGRWHGGPPRGFDITLGPIGNALEPEDRHAIGDRLRANPDMRPRNGRERRGDAVALVAGLRADPYDPAVTEAFFDETRARASGLQAMAHAALVTQITNMTPEKRAAFADRLEDEMRRHGPPPER